MTSPLSQICQRLDPLVTRYFEWELPLRRFRAKNIGRLNKNGYSWVDFERELDELEASLAGQDDPRPEINALLEQLCTAYLDADADADANDRAATRAFVGERKKLCELTWRFANRTRKGIRSPGDAPLLSLALAAVAIENCATDYRDTLATMADLFVGAEEAGVDPRPHFAAVSALAADERTRGGCLSLAAILREFPTNSVLNERRGMGQPYGGPA